MGEYHRRRLFDKTIQQCRGVVSAMKQRTTRRFAAVFRGERSGKMVTGQVAADEKDITHVIATDKVVAEF